MALVSSSVMNIDMARRAGSNGMEAKGYFIFSSFMRCSVVRGLLYASMSITDSGSISGRRSLRLLLRTPFTM